MTWGGQVRHVYAKDLREVWWLLAGFVAATVMTVVRVTVDQPADVDLFDRWEFFVPITGLLLTAWVILADPPSRATAFWATQPFRPSAMLGAKLLHAIPMSLMTVAGMVVVLRWWGLPWGDVMATVPITIVGTITIVISAVLMTVSSGDVKSIVTGFALAVVTMFLSRQLLGDVTGNVAMALWAVLLICDVWLVARLYGHRDVAWPARTAGSALLVLTFAFSIALRQPALPDVPSDTPQRAGTLLVSPSATRRQGFGASVDGIVTDAADVRLRNATLRVVLPNGNSDEFPVQLEGMRTRPQEPGDTAMRAKTLLITTDPVYVATWNRLYSAGARVIFDGVVEERRWVESRRLPLVTGEIPTEEAGARLYLRMVPNDSTTLAVITGKGLRIRRTSRDEFNISSNDARLSLARRGGPVIRELVKSSSGWGRGLNPLPGFHLMDERVELTPKGSPDSLLRDTSWWPSHELVVSELTPSRVYRVHAETVIPR